MNDMWQTYHLLTWIKLNWRPFSLELNNCIPLKKHNIIESQAQLEYFFDHVSKCNVITDDMNIWLNAKLVDLEHQYRTAKTKQISLLHKDHMDAPSKLNNHTFTFLHSDKGSSVVILNRNDYIKRWKQSYLIHKKFKSVRIAIIPQS